MKHKSCFVNIVIVVVLLVVSSRGLADADKDTAMSAAGLEKQGFKQIFNGKDLTSWDGDPRLWSVVDGVIRGQTTPEKKARHNTFCIWRGDEVKNFILKIKFRIQNGNSGIQYRSKEFDKWRVSGYQAEVEDTPGKVGFLYHESGRGWLVNVGDFVLIDEKGKKETVGQVNNPQTLIKNGYYKKQDWNEYTIIARGNHVVHVLNGHQTVELIDNDPAGRCMDGVLALQIHKGKPMVVEFKDIYLKQLPDEKYGTARRLFNGKNLEGWTFSSDEQKATWSVKDGVLHDAGKPNGYIRTEETFANYILRLQFRHITKGNSGVLLRVTGEDKVWPRSLEAQGMFGNVGDIYNIGDFPAKTDPERTRGRRTQKIHPANEKPLGEWNRYEIVFDHDNFRIYVNRLLQNAAEDCWETPGWIALQSEGARLEFRNIVLIPIEK